MTCHDMHIALNVGEHGFSSRNLKVNYLVSANYQLQNSFVVSHQSSILV